MFVFSQLSIKSKLVLMLLGVSICSILVIGYEGYRNGKHALEESIYKHLTSLREAKALEVESYFSELQHELQVFSEDHMITSAMQEFRHGFRYLRIDDLSVTDEQKQAVHAYYEHEFLPRLTENTEGEPQVNDFLPQTMEANYLQYHYTAVNPQPDPVDEKDILPRAPDESYYSVVHERYHPVLLKITEKFGYADLFLIDVETGDVVYSVSKQTDYATNLLSGPYRESGLARAARALRKFIRRDAITFEDFLPYTPASYAPAAFMAVPIFAQNECIGLLAIEVSIDTLNSVMTAGYRWQASGFGDTGEVYLVGSDYLMRSVSRAHYEDPEHYVEQLQAHYIPQEQLKRVVRFHTTVLQQEVRSESALLAVAGQHGTQLVEGYRGLDVLSSYAPLRIEGVNWSVIAELEADEAFAPLRQFEREVIVAASILALAVTFVAMWLSSVFVTPIQKLTRGVRQLADGDTQVRVELSSRDEFGELAESFNAMADAIHEKNTTIETQAKENEALLLNILPSVVAQRLKDGERRIADSYPNVSVLFTTLDGFTDQAAHLSPQDAFGLINQLVDAFDEAAEEIGIEKVKTLGDSYMAACGLTVPRLDHAKRAVEFAARALHIVFRFNQERDMQLALRIGIHTGPVLAGIVGRSKFVYDLWGNTVNVASRIRYEAKPNAIQVTQQVYERLPHPRGFVACLPLQTKGMGLLKTWQWQPDFLGDETQGVESELPAAAQEDSPFAAEDEASVVSIKQT